MPKSKRITVERKRYLAFESVAHYILDTKERDDYISWCEELELNPFKIRGRIQKKHVYTSALIAMGLTFFDV